MPGPGRLLPSSAALLAAAIVWLGPAKAVAADGQRSPWLPVPSIALAQDFAWSSGTDVCTEKSQLTLGWSCFRASGSQYHGTPVEGADDAVRGGFVPATERVLLGADVTPLPNLTAGVRVGYAFGGGPRPDSGDPFLPFHLELRAAWWPLGPAWRTGTVSPYVLASGGAAQIDSRSTVPVHEDRTVLPPPSQLDNPDNQDLDAWKKLGRAFVGGGIGAYYGFDAAGGVFAEVRAMVLFPSNGTAVELAVGWALPL